MMAGRREGKNEWWWNERTTGPVMSDRDVTIRNLITVGHECTVSVLLHLHPSYSKKYSK